MTNSEKIQQLEEQKQKEGITFEERLEIEDQILELKYEDGKDRPSFHQIQCIGCGS